MVRHAREFGRQRRRFERPHDAFPAVSDPIIQEVRRHLLGKFGWSEPRAAEAVESITEFAKHVTPTEAIDTVPTDPDDNRVLECAVSAGSQTIVTGDDDLLRLVAFS